MRILQTEVTKLKEILKHLKNDLSIKISFEVKSEIQSMIDMPDVMSPGRSLMQ